MQRGEWTGTHAVHQHHKLLPAVELAEWFAARGGCRFQALAAFNVFATLDETELVQALQLLATERRLEGEIKLGETLDGRQPAGAHRGLQPSVVTQLDLRAEQGSDRAAAADKQPTGASPTHTSAAPGPTSSTPVDSRPSRSRSSTGRVVV